MTPALRDYRDPGPRFRAIEARRTEDEEQRHLQEKHQPPRMQKRQPAKIAIEFDESCPRRVQPQSTGAESASSATP